MSVNGSTWPAAVPARRRRGQSGQAAIENALVYIALLLPLTAMMIFSAQMLWVWHSVVDFTRDGARYAVTHCYQPGGANVVSYMRQNVPPMVDRIQFEQGEVDIEVLYYSRDPETGDIVEFACEGSECSRECVPEAVTVRVANYEYRHFFSYLGLPPVAIPSFQTSLPMESAGCGPDSEDCLP